MAGNYLLDTNIAILILNQDAAAFQAKLDVATVYISTTVLGELYYGAYKSARTTANLKNIQNWIADYEMLACDAATAEHYGEIKSQLETKGRRIPDNDIWIAAVAKQHNLTLITRDEHFNAVDRLTVEKW